MFMKLHGVTHALCVTNQIGLKQNKNKTGTYWKSQHNILVKTCQPKNIFCFKIDSQTKAQK